MPPNDPFKAMRDDMAAKQQRVYQQQTTQNHAAFQRNLADDRARTNLHQKELLAQPRPGLFCGGTHKSYSGPVINDPIHVAGSNNGLVKLVGFLVAAFVGWKTMLAVPASYHFGGAVLGAAAVAIMAYKLITSEMVARLILSGIKLVVILACVYLLLYFATHLHS